LVVAALGLGSSVVVERLVVEDDPAETAANIAGSEALFRVVIAGLLVVAASTLLWPARFQGLTTGGSAAGLQPRVSGLEQHEVQP
jgi:hypothetical protein